jgi:hypothetical protein
MEKLVEIFTLRASPLIPLWDHHIASRGIGEGDTGDFACPPT